jgi:hypothetical protein
LGGSAASWDLQKTWTDENYRASVILCNYKETGLESSFHTLALKLNEQIGSGLTSGATEKYPDRCTYDDFAIVHSQGGIAGRFLDRQWDLNKNGTFGNRKFYGIVSFGTPHAGADISITKDQHNAFVKEVVSSIYLERPYGLIYDFSQSFVGRFLGIKGRDLITKIDEAIENNLVPAMLAAVQAPTLDEMKPNSNTMTSINGHKSRLRKVAFYGIEDAPECWRVMSNITDTASEDYPIWQATRDDHFLKKMEMARHKHKGASRALSADIDIWLTKKQSAIGIFMNNSKYLELVDEKKHREEAITFLNNANTHWRYLIGSLHRDSFNIVTKEKFILKWDEKYGRFGRWYHQERSFYDLNKAVTYSNEVDKRVYKVRKKRIVTVQETRKVQKLFPSDGVVLKKSQLAFPGVGKRTDKMEGDNHFQERNSPETYRVMKKLYLGDYDSYFYTTPQ